VLRRIDPAGNVSTFAAGFGAPVAVEGGPGNTVHFADGQANAVFRLDPQDGSRTRVARGKRPLQPRRRAHERVRVGADRRAARAPAPAGAASASASSFVSASSAHPQLVEQGAERRMALEVPDPLVEDFPSPQDLV
jgi:hypothetical protein